MKAKLQSILGRLAGLARAGTVRQQHHRAAEPPPKESKDMTTKAHAARKKKAAAAARTKGKGKRAGGCGQQFVDEPLG